MAITFNTIPSNARAPLFAVEFDNSLNETTASQRALIIGAGNNSANNNEAKRVFRGNEREVFGESFLTDMISAYFLNNRNVELYGISKTIESGSKASLTITFTIDALASGSPDTQIYIGARRVPATIPPGSTPTQAATILAAAINSANVPVSASGVAGALTISAKQDGALGNEIEVSNVLSDTDNPIDGLATDDFGKLTGGTGIIDYSDLTLGDVRYDYIIIADTQKATIQPLITELESRISASRQLEGLIFTSASGNQSELTTLGDGFNERAISILGINGSATPTYEIAGAYGGLAASSLSVDPAIPLQGLFLQGVSVPSSSNSFDYDERNGLLFSGISVGNSNSAGNRFLIEASITTYQVNDSGADDTSYLYINTLATLFYLRRDWNNLLARKFQGKKLRADSGRIASPNVVTPESISAEFIALAGSWADDGFIEDFDAFVSSVRAEINGSNPNRVDIIGNPNLINQLRIVATKFSFIN